MQKNYPCTAAIQSSTRGEYVVGVYEDFGSARFWREIREDLRAFLEEQKRTDSTFLTYWAVFQGRSEFTEEDFETRLWKELSHLSSIEQRSTDWPTLESADPQTPGFCLSIEGHEFFVVGLHPGSSRTARRFSQPALVFNAIAQFENLERSGEYEQMKETIRKRDMRFQGSVNPLVLKYGDQWESIQFSGKDNPPNWRCPFHFLHEKDKP